MEQGVPYFRLNTEDMPLDIEGSARFPESDFIVKNEINVEIDSKQITGVWYRRPKMMTLSQGVDRHTFSYVQEDSWFFVNGLLELVNDSAVWVSRPENIRRAENKLYQLKIAQRCGLRVPITNIGNSPDEIKRLISKMRSYNRHLVVKPVRSGRYFLQNELKIFHTTQFPLQWEPDEIKIWPVIVQEQITKKRDVRVTIFRDTVLSVGINTNGFPDDIKLDWRKAIDDVAYEPLYLPDGISRRLLSMMQIMGIAFGAFDLIETQEGEYIFLEVNPNGQWAWIEQKTDLPMREALFKTLQRGSYAE